MEIIKDEKFYKDIYKRYDNWINYRAKMINRDYAEDIAQEVRIFLYSYLKKYDGSIDIDLFIKTILKAGFRRAIFDTKKQEQFERSMVCVSDFSWIRNIYYKDNMDSLIEKIVYNLSIKQKVVFYSILYLGHLNNYKNIANIVGMKYATFLKNLKDIRFIIDNITLKDTN